MTSAMPDMPMPPIPMKWMAPILSGRAVPGLMGYSPLYSRARVSGRPARRKFLGQVGKGFRGLRAAFRAGRLCHGSGVRRIAKNGGDLAREVLRRQLAFRDGNGRASLDQGARIGALLVPPRDGQRDQDGGPA